MPYVKVSYERTALYEEVWNEPVTLAVPLPPLGYWTTTCALACAGDVQGRRAVRLASAPIPRAEHLAVAATRVELDRRSFTATVVTSSAHPC
jgi:hypothetical protein